MNNPDDSWRCRRVRAGLERSLEPKHFLIDWKGKRNLYHSSYITKHHLAEQYNLSDNTPDQDQKDTQHSRMPVWGPSGRGDRW